MELEKNSPCVGHSLVSSGRDEIAEVFMLIEDLDNIIEKIEIKTFGSELFRQLADFVVLSITGICIEDARNIDASLLAQEYNLEQSDLHLAYTIESAVKKAIENYISKLNV